MKYTIIKDFGKPSQKVVNSLEELKQALTDIYNNLTDDEGDIIVLDENYTDITETQLIQEMIVDIMEE